MNDISTQIEGMDSREHVLARQCLQRRYVWEVDAITQDIINKLEMEVLTVPSIASYLSNLLMTHPRSKSEERAAETLMVSAGRTEDVSNALDVLDKWPTEEVVDPALCQLAYYAMGQDVINALEKHQVHVKPIGE